MDNGEPPEGWSNWLHTFLQRHFLRAKVTETKNRGCAKKGNQSEDGEGVPAKSRVIPREGTRDSSSPPLVAAHKSEAQLVIAGTETNDGAKKRHRRRRRRTKPLLDPSSVLQPEELIEPATVVVAAHERPLDAPAPVVVAAHERPLDAPAPVVVAADMEGWQDVRKKRRGGRTERAAQGLTLEPTIAEQDALQPTIAEQEQAPKAIVHDPRPVKAFNIVPAPKDAPRVGTVPSDGWQFPKKPRARWSPTPTPPRLAPPTPPRRASPPGRSTHQGDEREEENGYFGIKSMSELEGRVADEEDNERGEEEKKMHLSYWIRNKKLGKGKTLCLICYMEQKPKVAEIENEEKKANRHLKVAHNIESTSASKTGVG